MGALDRVAEIRVSVDKLREKLSSDQGDAEDIERRITALLAEAAAIRQNQLTAPFSKKLPLSGKPDQIPIGDILEDFLTSGSPVLALRVTPPPAPPAAPGYSCADSNALCLPNPEVPMAQWQVSVVFERENLTSGTITAPVPQWASAVELPLKVGFAGNRTFSASYDAFGRQTTAKWGSEARGATMTEALAGYAETVADLDDALKDPTELEQQKAEIEELETRQKLNRLRACRDILAAGGSSCPAEAPTSPN